MKHIKHFTWKEIPNQYGTTKSECSRILKNWQDKVIQDYTMIVEFYPGEVLDNDLEEIKIAIEDFNIHFPDSNVEFNGDPNMCIILDTLEKQLWAFFEFEDLMKNVENIKTLDKGEGGFRTIQQVFVNSDAGQEFICFECYPGSSVKKYLKGLLEKTGLAQHVSKEMEFEDYGDEHLYSVEINKDSLKYFIENI